MDRHIQVETARRKWPSVIEILHDFVVQYIKYYRENIYIFAKILNPCAHRSICMWRMIRHRLWLFLCFLCDTNKAIRKKQIVIRNEVNLIEENRNFGASLKWKRPNDTLVPQFQVISIISFLIYCTRKDESEQQKKTVAVFCRRLFNRMDRTDVAHKKPKRRKRFSSSFSFRVHWLMA